MIRQELNHPGSAAAPVSRSRPWLAVLLIVPIAGAAFVAGRRSSPAATQATINIAAAQIESRTPTAGPRRALNGVPSFVATTAQADPEVEGKVRQAQATKVFTSFLEKVGNPDLFPESMGPEYRANSVQGYLNGAVDAVRMLDPSLKDALAEEFTRMLCSSSQLPDEKVILLAYFGQLMPEATTLAGFECFFARAARKEDVSLWHMLDAWRLSGRDRPESLNVVQRTATDRRTLDRLRDNRPGLAQHPHQRN